MTQTLMAPAPLPIATEQRNPKQELALVVQQKLANVTGLVPQTLERIVKAVESGRISQITVAAAANLSNGLARSCL
jgi:hypothetical protein